MKSLSIAIALKLALVSSSAVAVPSEGSHIMTAGASPYAVQIARDISLKGGNAVDAAVAIALSLAVTHPYYAAFGGGGFAMVKVDSRIEALDFREKAPLKAKPEMYESKPVAASRTGGLAIGVPGVAAGLWELHHRYGHLKWNALFTAAIDLAEGGFRVSGEWVKNTNSTGTRFNDAGLKFFFKSKAEPYKPGELLKQPALGKFLRQYRTQGPDIFYKGTFAKELIDVSNATGGILSLEDLSAYNVRWLTPLQTQFNGYRVSLMPPPSSGGVLAIEALKLMEKLKLSDNAFLSIDEYHKLIEILKLSYHGRAQLGDPEMSHLPIDQLTGDSYISSLAAMFKPDHALDTEKVPELNFEKEETTHLSVMDAAGNAVAMTITLNGDYGSGVVTPKTGIALNNEMDDFTTHIGKPNMFGLIQGQANTVRASARPLSSMTPTIVEKDGRTVLAVGAPGGPRITSAVIQVLYRILGQNLEVDHAIQTPRVHHQFTPNSVKYDEFRFTPETLAGLKAKGHVLETGSTARVSGVFRAADGVLQGACDSRGECAAGGY